MQDRPIQLRRADRAIERPARARGDGGSIRSPTMQANEKHLAHMGEAVVGARHS
jgi:hypothetical protein